MISYFFSNRERLLPYQKQGLDISESPEGITYRDMGTMEKHVSGIMAHQMKHRHCFWSIEGGNRLAKILAKKYMGRHYEGMEKLRVPLFEKVEGILDSLTGDILLPRDMPERIGTGSAYPTAGYFPILSSAITADSHKRLVLAGY